MRTWPYRKGSPRLIFSDREKAWGWALGERTCSRCHSELWQTQGQKSGLWILSPMLFEWVPDAFRKIQLFFLSGSSQDPSQGCRKDPGSTEAIRPPQKFHLLSNPFLPILPHPALISQRTLVLRPHLFTDHTNHAYAMPQSSRFLLLSLLARGQPAAPINLPRSCANKCVWGDEIVRC